MVSKLKGHGKKVTAVVFAGKTHEGLVLTGKGVNHTTTEDEEGRQAGRQETQDMSGSTRPLQYRQDHG